MKFRFDFLNETLIFRSPDKIIQTDNIADIESKFAEIERWVAKGFYAAGFISYEAAKGFRPYYQTPPKGKLPLLYFAICRQVSQPDDTETLAKYSECFWQPNTNKDQYYQAINRIKQQIEMGNTYQVNYTLRLNSQFDGNSYAFYLYLLNAQKANYSAYLDTGRFKILSASPELFFHKQGRTITTKPMKGTAPRAMTFGDDMLHRQRLSSEKNQAENIMIVDLLRNDLSQIARSGSVKVTDLLTVEKYPTVWQLTSTITADIAEDKSLFTIFQALFPCGSITGAPKVSTMKLIAELEHDAREVYCGAIGYISPDSEAIFNVPIRTVIVDSEQATAQYGAGGGITWDSTPQDEYQEIVNKTQILRGITIPEKLLETLLLEHGQYYLLSEHLRRLAHSASYFDFAFDRDRIMTELELIAQKNSHCAYKVRLLLNRRGETTTERHDIDFTEEAILARWASDSINSKNPLLYHKTTERDHYPVPLPGEECLLYNERDEITEFTNGNVVLLLNGALITPSVSCGLLPGTMRGELIKRGEVSEAIIHKSQLDAADKIFFINSVRKWRPVQWLTTQPE